MLSTRTSKVLYNSECNVFEKNDESSLDSGESIGSYQGKDFKEGKLGKAKSCCLDSRGSKLLYEYLYECKGFPSPDDGNGCDNKLKKKKKKCSKKCEPSQVGCIELCSNDVLGPFSIVLKKCNPQSFCKNEEVNIVPISIKMSCFNTLYNIPTGFITFTIKYNTPRFIGVDVIVDPEAYPQKIYYPLTICFEYWISDKPSPCSMSSCLSSPGNDEVQFIPID